MLQILLFCNIIELMQKLEYNVRNKGVIAGKYIKHIGGSYGDFC